MKDTPVSKTQIRALRLLGLGQAETYSEAADRLEANGFSRDGMPLDHTWRTTAKLSDAELIHLLKIDREAREDDTECVPDGFGGVQ